MSHAQQQLLEAVEAVLKAADTDAGDRVFLDRLDVLEDRELPALLVAEAPEGEQLVPSTLSGAEQRELSVLVVAVVAQAEGYAAQVREIGRQVEVALTARTFAVPKPGRARLDRSRMLLSGDGDKARAARELTWRLTYFTRRGAPDQPF